MMPFFSPSAGVSQICFWPGDPEVSMLKSTSSDHSKSRPNGLSRVMSEEAELDAVTAEKLKSNSRSHICVLLQPLAPDLVQFMNETSKESDFMERMADDDPELNTNALFNR